MSDSTYARGKSSLQARVVRAVTSAYFDLFDPQKADVEKSRKRLALLGSLVPVARDVTVEKIVVNGLPAEWLRPKKSLKNKMLLYLHGGAYVLGGCDSHRHLVSHLAREGQIDALVPEYRLAPEHPFPCGIDDVVGVYKALLADGFSPGDIIIGGDSAGGGLAVATLLTLRDEGIDMPAKAILLSPLLDLAASGETIQSRRHVEPWFRAEDLAVLASFYCAGNQIRDPRVSPVYADLHGMPQVYVQVGNDEILLSDATRLVDNIRNAGGQAEIEVFENMWHVFQAFLLVVPESRDAIAKLAENVQATFK